MGTYSFARFKQCLYCQTHHLKKLIFEHREMDLQKLLFINQHTGSDPLIML